MTTLAETPSLTPSNEQLPLQRKQLSPVSRALNRFAELAIDTADTIETRKRQKLDARVQQLLGEIEESNEIYVPESFIEEFESKNASAEQGSETEDSTERSSRGKDILRNIGSGAIGALRGAGEFAVGAGILGSRKIKDSAEAFGTKVDGVIEKADAGYNKFDAKLENFADNLLDRKDAAVQNIAERRAERSEQKALADYDKMRDNANAENDRFDAKAEKVKQRAAEALIRKDARKQKWASRKAAVAQAFTTVKTATINGANAAVNFGIDTAAGAKNLYETVSDKAVEITNKGVDNILFGANDAAESISTGIDKTVGAATYVAERGREAYEGAVSAGERLKMRAGEVRAVGAAAIEGARVYGGAASQQARANRTNA